ncbi:MAG: DUF4402 domain-containing protein [Sphingomonadales bacterium]|nr:MAG: DUF4402 domain-containing protein [Sphingomonadales bacterium]
MRNMIKFGMFAAGTLIAAPAFAQTGTDTATGSTTIVRPVTITKDADLAFGKIVRPPSGTSAVSMTDASDTVSADNGGLAVGTGTSRAKFTINGEGAQVVTLTVPANFVMTRSGGAETLTVTLDPDLGATTTLSSTLGTAGTKALNIGGSFSVLSTTVTGLYSGTFDVSVAYQ